ncbi:hypothetical protein ES707_21666 [subsurface metagenome]
MERLPPLVRLVESLKFVGLLILVSIGLMAGFIGTWVKEYMWGKIKR